MLGIASLVAQSVTNLPAVQEIWVRSLGLEDPLEKEMDSPPGSSVHGTFQARVLEWGAEVTREQPPALSDKLNGRLDHPGSQQGAPGSCEDSE